MNGQYINEKAFSLRRQYFIAKSNGVLCEKVPGATNPMSNPTAMIDMMKGNLVGMLPNFALMTFVGYFFAGFVCLKVPFPMPSNHFRYFPAFRFIAIHAFLCKLTYSSFFPD